MQIRQFFLQVDIGGHTLWMYNTETGELIFVPISLRQEMMDWHHLCLHHSGAEMMSLIIMKYFYWYRIITDITKFVRKCATY